MDSTLQQFPPPPFPPLHITTDTYTPSSFHRRPSSETSSSSSSRATSPPASPTTTLRRHHHHHHHQLKDQTSPHHLFNLSFHPSTVHAKEEFGADRNPTVRQGRARESYSPPRTSRWGVDILKGSVLRGRSSLMVLRRRPSAVDRALSEERSRCDEDAIERQGLDLMEPRPVDMQLPITMLMEEPAAIHRRSPSTSSGRSDPDSRSTAAHHPCFVMGGIFEVMEGRV
ncbi:hypothetical protein N7539_002776 [Penicillium diatomitis]|uniref:Uncharacterized protein n=1 Tax=Penicillium diatomitis TaxID=2819901 RepID=A0A9W9XFF6_9EURO|nr:uncharacterized protein N7539_002776 [Penicillium diatomitis]KAJ5491209.1 hypothetical protein N7539_002776 [Penicillium diatomitis]